MRGEGTFEYEALLFLPARAPFDLFHADAKRGVQLYVKRVFIMDDCAELIPSFLRFVKGVVDAHDLSLNVSRELLQRDRQIQVIRKRLVRKVLGTIKEMMTDRPEQYRAFWEQFGRALKEGLLQAEAGTSPDSRGETHEAILACSSFASTHDSSALTSLSEYVARMAEGQESIYVLVGESRAAIENSPHLEAFKAKGLEVLLLTDPVDEIWVDLGLRFDGKPFQSVARGQVDLPGGATDAETEQRGKEFEPLLSFMTARLADQVKEVRLSSRLTTSPACVVVDAGDITPALQRMLKAMGQEAPSSKAILELNPDHPLVVRLREAHAERPDDQALEGTVELLYGTAVLAEGGELSDPARFARLLADRLAATV
jgi:molecular chaperone HtpG